MYVVTRTNTRKKATKNLIKMGGSYSFFKYKRFRHIAVSYIYVLCCDKRQDCKLPRKHVYVNLYKYSKIFSICVASLQKGPHVAKIKN